MDERLKWRAKESDYTPTLLMMMICWGRHINLCERKKQKQHTTMVTANKPPHKSKQVHKRDDNRPETITQ